MLLLKNQTFEVENDGPRVTAEEAGAIAKAEDIIAAAEREAARIAEEAKTAAADEKRRGYEEGLEAGKGEILMQKLDLIDESVRYMASIEQKVSDIVMKALKKCIAEIGDKELVIQVVRKAMQAVVRNQQQIRVKVGTDLVDVVKSRTADMLRDFPSVNFIDVVEDPHLVGSACVVETEAGIVEASVDGQLAAIERSIRKNLTQEEV